MSPLDRCPFAPSGMGRAFLPRPRATQSGDDSSTICDRTTDEVLQTLHERVRSGTVEEDSEHWVLLNYVEFLSFPFVFLYSFPRFLHRFPIRYS